ncbi:MAG: hypothetical protein QXY40_01295 [Candidatus Methanomethylicia archaeon]
MSLNEEEIKKLANLKKSLEERITEYEKVLNDLKICLKLVDDQLSKSSFKTAAEMITAPTPSQISTPKAGEVESILRALKTGAVLGKFIEGDNYIRVEVSQNLKLDPEIPPLRTFLINKVLEGMRNADLEKVEKGQLPADKIIEYNVKIEDNVFKGLEIKNITDRRRIVELKNSIRWTLERMVEKTQGGG